MSKWSCKTLQCKCPSHTRSLPWNIPQCIVGAGVPNTGKSSLINALRKAASLPYGSRRGGTAVTGPNPGVTRHLSAFQVCPVLESTRQSLIMLVCEPSSTSWPLM